MTRLRIAPGMVLLALLLTLPASAPAQDPPPQAPGAIPAPLPPRPEIPAQPDAPPVPERPDDFEDVFARGTRGVVRIGQPFTLAAGDAVREAVVIFGNATIAGQVDRDVLVVLGTARLASTAVIGQNLVVVGGGAVVEPGATLRRDLVVVGGAFDAPPGFTPGGEHVVIGSGVLGGWFEGLVPYVARGLVWGRLIVPDLPWVWGIVGVFFLLYLALNVLFERPVYACTRTLAAKPLTAFGAGLLVLLLIGPVSLLLAVSVIGLAVVPFVFCALLAAWILGKVGVMRWIGMAVMPEDVPARRAESIRSFAIGFVLISIAYMIPVLGIVTWAIVGVLGLGAAALTFFEAYRRENPQKPAAPTPDVPPPPVPMPYAHAPAAAPPPPPAAAFDASGAAGAATATAAPHTAAPYAAARQGVALVSMPKALFRDRLAAFVLDIILVAIAVSILDVEGDDVFLPFLLVYHIAFWTWKQTTVGGIICQLRVTRVDGAPLTFADALVRGLSAIFSLAVLLIGALWILRDPDSQAWHDKIAGTYVVKVPRNWPL